MLSYLFVFVLGKTEVSKGLLKLNKKLSIFYKAGAGNSKDYILLS